MKISYTLGFDDFLSFQLYVFSNSDRIQKKKQRGRFYLGIGSFALSLFFYFQEDALMFYYFAFIGVLILLFYPKYFNWRHKKHYSKHIQETYTERIGRTEELEISDDAILTKDNVGEGRLNLSAIKDVTETAEHFFINISSGQSFILPKRELEDVAEVKAKFQSVQLAICDDQQWSLDK